MTTPVTLQDGECLLFDSIVPPLSPGDYRVGAALSAQSLGPATADGSPRDVTAAIDVDADTSQGAAPGAVGATISVEGPRLTLGPGDIAALYPPANATDAADDMLVSVVLRRRTLPWERPVAPGVARTTPWMALLLFEKSEARIEQRQPFSRIGRSVPGIADNELCDQLVVQADKLLPLLPKANELALLCHARQLNRTESAAIKDDDGFVAIVLGNRVPKAQKDYLACLVSLEGAYGRLLAPGANVPASGEIRLVSLVSWSFHTGKQGDFEAYFHRLGKAGGSRMLGAGARAVDPRITDEVGLSALPAPTVDAPARTVLYSGPGVRVPFAPSKHFVRSAAQARMQLPGRGELVSYAAAFELGRLLALASPAALRGLLDLRANQYTRDLDTTTKTPIWPGDPRDWQKIIFGGVIDQPWFEDLGRFGGDPTGVAHLGSVIPGLTELLGEPGLEELRASLVAGERMDAAAGVAGPGVTMSPLIVGAAELEARFPSLASLASLAPRTIPGGRQ
jgi:hypothetical protein